MKVSDIMTRGAVTVTADSTIEAAARLMLSHRISGLPVVDAAGAVIGIVTEGDLLRRVEIGTEARRGRWFELLVGPGRLAGDYVRSHARKVGEVMTREVAGIGPEAPLAEAVALMERRHVKRLPVIDGGRVVGILSRANLLSALLEMLAAPTPGAGSDREIRERVLAEIDKQRWAPRVSIDVAVSQGIVELHGAITDERERTALRVAAENVPGVKGVRDHLVWIDVVSGMVLDR
ncbi:MAG TPA: CBS domain-containing protein [Stellaceae bacterium]|nr:CBS domain-containing protein [Stellaceae bacterium]